MCMFNRHNDPMASVYVCYTRISWTKDKVMYVFNMAFEDDIVERVDERKMTEYGVLVSAASNGEFLVTLTSQSPEGQFTQAVCTP